MAELNKNQAISFAEQKSKDDEDNDNDETLAEKDAREAELQKASEDKADSLFNKFTGNWDDPNGKKYFVDSFGKKTDQEVGGVNNFAERNKNKLQRIRSVARNNDDDDIKEADKAELEEFKANVAKAEQDKKDKEEGEKKEKARLSKQNRFDGTIHLENGEREFIDGGIVGGANNYHQSKPSKKRSR